jgi:histidyl-tRNA synthetase
MGAGPPVRRPLDALFAILADEARPRVHALMDDVRAAGVRCDAAYGGRRLKRALELADRRGVPTVVIVGDDEWAAGEATVRDMTTGEQRRVALETLAEELRR